ncbi:cytochrome P450 [Streptomyces sp. NPDC058534]|uniref:cytochrome P450 n=1 Tax=Streptomyces sp. NPDC058534 TaxID=3346541 RepID=UPI003668B448
MSEMPVFDPSQIPQLLPFDPLDPVVHHNPYPTYQKIREEHGSTYVSPLGLTSVLSHEAASQVLTSPKFGWGDNPMMHDQMVKAPNDPDGPLRPVLQFMDPPDHTRLRRLISKAFTPRMVARLRPKIAEYMVKLIDDAMAARDADGIVDLHKTVISPLAPTMLSELLNVPEKYHARFLSFFRASATGIDPSFLLTPEQIKARDEARADFMQVGMELAAERRVDPGDDLVSRLVMAEQDGDMLDEGEVAISIMMLLSAGTGATAGMFANCAFTLLSHPDQLAWLREHPDQIAPAVEELTRYDTPLQSTFRTALEPTEVAGVPLETGQPVIVLFGAANRDPAAYEDPDRLDLSRNNSVNHLGFGHGIHFCVAAPVARLTTQVALQALTSLDIELAKADPARPLGMVMRTVDELPVRLAGARP